MERKKKEPEGRSDDTNFYVYWDIIQDFSAIDSSQEDACIFVRERFFRTAKAIFALEKPSYIITISGYEPTCHPLLPDLFEFLFAQKASVHVLLRTDASRDEAYFKNLLQHCPQNTCELVISLNPEEHDENHIEKILDLAVQKKQRAQLTLYSTETNEASVRDWVKQLTVLRKTLPFGLRLSDAGGSQKIPSGLEDVFTAFSVAAKQGPALLPPFALPRAILIDEDCYCCVGANFLYIAPNGQYAPAFGNLVPLRKTRLWDAGKKTLAKLVRIEQCHGTLLTGPNSVLPVFLTRDEALDWLHAHEAESEKAKPKTHDARLGIPQVADVVQSRLQRLTLLQPDAGRGDADPEWVSEAIESLCMLYETLDSRSREILLRAMKSLETGELGYLPQCASSAYPFEAREGEVFFVSGSQKRAGSKGKTYTLAAVRKKAKSIDAFCQKEGEICSGLLLDVTDENFDALRSASETIVNFSPRILVHTGYLKQALTIPLWLKDRCPDHTISLWRDTEGDSGLCIVAEPNDLPARHCPKPTFSRPILSVIVPAASTDVTLQRSLESVLCQEFEDVELILVGDNALSDTLDSVARYARRYPDRVKILCVGSGRDENSRAYALNAGLDIALGQYVTFLDPKDMLSWQFLPKSREIISAEQPDVIIFDRVLMSEGLFEHYSLKEGTSSGMESLEDFLLEKTGPCTLAGRLFNAERLRQMRIQFGEFGSDTDFAFAFLAQYHSRKTCVVAEIGTFQEKTSDVDYDTLGDEHTLAYFGAFVLWLTTFCKRHGLDPESPMFSNALIQAYQTKRDPLISSFSDAKDSSSSLSKTILEQLASSKTLVREILKDYALLYCHKENLNPTVAQDSLDWEAQPAEQGAREYEVYTDGKSAEKPALTVILSGSNDVHGLPATLESILSQKMQDFECVLVDDGTQPERYELLQSYADLNPNFRLFHMLEPADGDTCRNIGLGEARGQYILFVEDGDICEQGSFEKAIQAFEENEADIVSFSTEDIGSDGSVISSHECADEIYGEARCADFAAEQLNASLLGKIFDRSFLDRSAIHLSSDGLFLRDLAENASCIVTDSFVAFRHRAKSEEDVFQASYPKLRALYRVLSTMPSHDEQILKTLLQHIAAYWQTCQCVPMTDDDFHLLLRNADCLRSVFSGFAKLLADSEEEKGLLPKASLPSTSTYELTSSVQPFISIYNPNCMPSKEEIRLLRDAPALFGMFLTEYATRSIEDYHNLDLPTLDDLPPYERRMQPADYLIPCNQPIPNDIVLSVILVTRNSAENLDRSLNKLENVPGVEYLIVDDCSDTDESFLKCRAAQKKIPAIRLFRTPWQSGVGQARNLAMREARGSWLIFLEPDDWFSKGFVSQAIELLQIESKAELVDFSWQGVREENPVFFGQTMSQQNLKGKDLFKEWLDGKSGNIGLWSKALRTSFLEKNAITFLPHRKSDDFFFLVQSYTNVEHVAVSKIQSVSHCLDTNDFEHTPSLNEHAFLEACSSIHSMHTYLLKKGYTEDSEEYKKILQAFSDGTYTEVILLHTYLCKKLGQESPITLDIAKSLLSSEVFVQQCIYNFKKLKNNTFDHESTGKDVGVQENVRTA